MHRSSQRGFTLIELVVVIVILGILAAFAVPRFMGLETEARVAAVRSLAGTMRSAAAMGHGVCMARGCPLAATNIAIEGNNVQFVNTYPSPATIANVLSTLDGFTAVGGQPGRFQKTGARVPANCWVQYNAATVNAAGAVIPPTIQYPAGVQPGTTDNVVENNATLGLRVNC